LLSLGSGNATCKEGSSFVLTNSHIFLLRAFAGNCIGLGSAVISQLYCCTLGSRRRVLQAALMLPVVHGTLQIPTEGVATVGMGVASKYIYSCKNQSSYLTAKREGHAIFCAVRKGEHHPSPPQIRWHIFNTHIDCKARWGGNSWGRRSFMCVFDDIFRLLNNISTGNKNYAL
jgi:hypothetical protein